jgi:DNA repair photolyase
MYEFVTHTWNAIKGECPHGCTYCYMKRWGNLNKVRFDEKELKTDLGTGNFIFAGSSCDMFSKNIPHDWILRTLDHCRKFPNRYLFQSKNPSGMIGFLYNLDVVVCTTIETNRWYPEIMADSPMPKLRAYDMSLLPYKKYVTIEPIMDFDLDDLVRLIKACNPVQVNIGADSGNNGLPEPSYEKINALIEALSTFTAIAKKRNLGRIMKNPPNKHLHRTAQAGFLLE